MAAYKLDTYRLFIEQGIALTKPNGRCSMITPANFLTNNYLEPLRRFMLERSNIENILVIDGGVFRGVSVDNAIFVVRAGQPRDDGFSITHATLGSEGLRYGSELELSAAAVLDQDHALFTGSRHKDQSVLWRRLESVSTPLGSVAYVNFGKQLRDRKKFTKDVIQIDDLNQLPSGYRPCYTGRDVHRYSMEWSGLACLNSDVARRGGCWDSTRQDTANKRLTRQIGVYPEFALDTLGYQCLNTMFMVNVYNHVYNPRFLLGVLNSKLSQRLWSDRFYDQRRTFPKIKGTYLEQLPVPTIEGSNTEDKERHDRMVQLVDQMLEAKQRLAAARTERDRTFYEGKCATLDRQIDNLVYELYGLTTEEIDIVKEAAEKWPILPPQGMEFQFA